MTKSSSSLEFSQSCRRILLAEIKLATQNFNESLVIGRGGFGNVYKANFLYEGTLVFAAIKRLNSTSNQGAIEFWAEVDMLGKLRHCHLVSLIGYCNDGREMILVYEYMPYGTLEDHLHKLRTLSWLQRVKICVGAVRGLDYLHAGTGIRHGVIHRDVKSSNILLDYGRAAKISDFGLSKIGPTNQPSTYVYTLVKGTFGYLDPHYFSTGRLTRKSDVYAFGVVLFEVLCGKRAVDRSIEEEQWGLARWAQDSIKEGRLKQMVDSNLKGQISHKCLKEFAQLADRCLHSHPKQRPTMAEVVVSLESVLALQDKSNNPMHAGIKIFGRRLPTFHFPLTGETSGRGRSVESLEFYFGTDGGERIEILRYEPDIIRVATENFAEANKIRKNGLDMYKGWLQNGEGITVKQSYRDSPSSYQKYMNEASLLVHLEHENLVQLLGYSMEGTRLSFIYESALYRSLDCLIFDSEPGALLDWGKRKKIILGIARGLLYLHMHAPFRIVHSDIMPCNVILTESLEPKLSGFGVATIFAIGETSRSCDKIIGTLGYISPEDIQQSHLSTKADVYSFGVLVLQTITGQKYIMNFVQDVWRNWCAGTASSIIDPSMDGDSSLITRYIQIGLLCVPEDAVDRPTMDVVVLMLVSDSSLTLPIPKKVAYCGSYFKMLESNEKHDLQMLVSDDYNTRAVEEFMEELNLYPR